MSRQTATDSLAITRIQGAASTVAHRFSQVLDVKAELGECPQWNVDDQCLYWLDLLGNTINRFNPQTGVNKSWGLPAFPGCFAFRAGGGAIIAVRDGIYDFQFSTGVFQFMIAPTHDFGRLRFNDGRTDRQGRLWVGTTSVEIAKENDATGWYRYDGKAIDRLISPAAMTNGMAFSPDGKRMYRAQTMDRQIFTHDYDPISGTPSPAELFAQIPLALGVPDGATVDTQGNYWTALAADPRTGKGGGVARFAPDGSMEEYIETPVPNPTMVAFGGKGLSTLYITSGRLQQYVDYEVPALAGSLFALETKYCGIPETPFKAR